MKKSLIKLSVMMAFALSMLVVAMSGAFDFFTLEYIQSQRQSLLHCFNEHPLFFTCVYMGVYIIITGLSIPGATILTLLGGYVFGLVYGVLAVSFASAMGATLACILTRFLFKQWAESRYHKTLELVNQGIEKEGAFYLFALRLTPFIPFFVVNAVMGVTRMKIWVFYVISQVGMLPATIIYVFAGTQIAVIKSLSDITSSGMIASLMLLGILPLLTKKLVSELRKTKVMHHVKKPKTFDYNVIVVGAGAAGLVSSYISAAVHAKVLLVEKHRMGGDCLHTGCVPSKAMIQVAKLMHQITRTQDYGIKVSKPKADFLGVMSYIRQSIKSIEPHDSVERYTKLGVECMQGHAEIKDPYRVTIDGKLYTTKSIIVATGAKPVIPKIEGLADIDYVTSDNVWNLTSLPKHMVVLGGGPVGCELAQSFARLGSNVTIIEKQNQLFGLDDDWVGEVVQSHMLSEGITILNNSQLIRCKKSKVVTENKHGTEKEIRCDVLLIALGRKANISGFGLENLPIDYNKDSTIMVNRYMQSSVPTIYACGDVAGPYQFTHMASHQAWYASMNALFGSLKRFKVDYSIVPRVTYTDPMVAHVGLSKKQAEQSSIAYEVTNYNVSDLDRAIVDGCAYGRIEVLTKPGSDRILGATIVATHADSMLGTWVMAMKHNIGMSKILSTIVPYPTWLEANKYVAGYWRHARKPKFVMSMITMFHRLRRRA